MLTRYLGSYENREKQVFSIFLNDLLISHINVNPTYYLNDTINIQSVVDVKRCIWNDKLKLLSYTLFQHWDRNKLVWEVEPNASWVWRRVRQLSASHCQRSSRNKDGHRPMKTAQTMAWLLHPKRQRNPHVHRKFENPPNKSRGPYTHVTIRVFINY